MKTLGATFVKYLTNDITISNYSDTDVFLINEQSDIQYQVGANSQYLVPQGDYSIKPMKGNIRWLIGETDDRTLEIDIYNDLRKNRSLSGK